MKVAARIVVLFLVIGVTVAGCKKQDTNVGSVQRIDASKFRPAFSSSPPELQAIVDSVMMSMQGSDTLKARIELDRLAKMPGVTDAQQKVIKDLGDQLDKKIALDANAAAPKQ